MFLSVIPMKLPEHSSESPGFSVPAVGLTE
jgi:hypothetical protein